MKDVYKVMTRPLAGVNDDKFLGFFEGFQKASTRLAKKDGRTEENYPAVMIHRLFSIAARKPSKEIDSLDDDAVVTLPLAEVSAALRSARKRVFRS